MELYDINNIPLSQDPRLRSVQEKILSHGELSMGDRVLAGRDHTVTEIDGYMLKPDHAYRAIDEETLKIYETAGFVISDRENDEYEEVVENGQVFNNNKGIDWFLGGVAPKYGDVIIECPASKEYFTLAYDNGNHLSFDPRVKHLKSSGRNNPVPISMITKVIRINELKEITPEVSSKR